MGFCGLHKPLTILIIFVLAIPHVSFLGLHIIILHILLAHIFRSGALSKLLAFIAPVALITAGFLGRLNTRDAYLTRFHARHSVLALAVKFSFAIIFLGVE